MSVVPKPARKKEETKEACKKCGNKGYQPWECCQKDSKCHKCYKVGHLTKVCRSKSTEKQGSETKWIGLYVDSIEHVELPLYTINTKLNTPF